MQTQLQLLVLAEMDQRNIGAVLVDGRWVWRQDVRRDDDRGYRSARDVMLALRHNAPTRGPVTYGTYAGPRKEDA